MSHPQGARTRFVGLALDEVRATRTSLYEVTTTAGVPVRLHDMSLTRLVYEAGARTLVMEFVYDDPEWTPPEAEATPVAVYAFDEVEVMEHREEPGAPGGPSQSDFFDYDETSGFFTFSTYASEWLFRARVATVTLQPPNLQ